VFARKTSEPLASLVKKIDSKIGENDALKSFVVILTDDGEKAADDLRKLARDGSVKHVPLTLHQDPAGPSDYEIAKDADVTVLMWKGHKVKVNRAYKGELTEADVRDIMADIPKVLGE
jgi:predicted TIM-barrel fold metal-dependent hydrolase